MIVKNLRYSAIALAAIAFCSCQKEPSTSDLHRDYLVYTARDTGTDFAAIEIGRASCRERVYLLV